MHCGVGWKGLVDGRGEDENFESTMAVSCCDDVLWSDDGGKGTRSGK